MAAAAPKLVHVDYGNDVVEFQWRYDVSGLKKGDSLREHYTGDEFIDHVGITAADLFNPTGAEITTNAVPGQYGVGAYHGIDGGIAGVDGDWIRTANRVPIKGDGLCTVHQHITMPNAVHSTELRLRPTLDQFESRSKANNRKGISLWAGMKPENVTAGVHTSKVGDKTRYVVPATGPDGTKSAMHTYIARNAKKPDFMNGAYFHTKAKMATHTDGTQAYVIENPDHFTAMKKLLTYLVETHSPYHRGLGMSVTKLDDVVTTEPLVVSMKFKRTPVSKEGFQALTEDAATTESDLRRLVNGGEDEPEMVTESGELIQVPGFEDELAKAQNPEEFAAAHTYEPYVEDAE